MFYDEKTFLSFLNACYQEKTLSSRKGVAARIVPNGTDLPPVKKLVLLQKKQFFYWTPCEIKLSKFQIVELVPGAIDNG